MLLMVMTIAVKEIAAHFYNNQHKNLETQDNFF